MMCPAGGALRRRVSLAGPGQFAIAVAMLCFFAAAGLAQGQGIGGTGNQPGEGNGIGGTGTLQNQPTGIIGTITGFGSILVNNYEVDYSGDTQTKSDLDDVREAKSLRIGQVVEIEADGQGKRVRARRIVVRYEVAGPIESSDRASGTIRVLGQTVVVGHDGMGQPGNLASGSIANLAVGDTVKVSGLRRTDRVIVASRIDKAEPGKPVWLRGQVDKAEDSAFVLNGVRVVPTAPDPALRPAAGEEVALAGVYVQGRFTPARVVRLPKTPFAGRPMRLSIEGYVGSRAGGGRFIGGLSLGGTAGEFRPGDRVIAGGRIGNGRFIPTHVQQSQFHRFMRDRGRPDHRPNDRKFRRDGHSPRGFGRDGHSQHRFGRDGRAQHGPHGGYGGWRGRPHPGMQGHRGMQRAPAHRGYGGRGGRGRR